MSLRKFIICVLIFLNWNFSHSQDCFHNRTEYSGVICSPNYPSLYDKNVDCTYIIRSLTNNPMSLFFMDFDVELGNNNCNKDYVQITDWDSMDLRKICGTYIPLPVFSLSGTITLQFHTDSSEEKMGFKARFNDNDECVHVIQADENERSIQSPNYPEHYPNNAACLYYIYSKNRLPINLTFVDFDVESTGSCRYDKVLVRDGKDKSKLSGPSCGNTSLPAVPIFPSGTILLIFITGRIITRRGFSALFKEVTDNSIENMTITVSTPVDVSTATTELDNPIENMTSTVSFPVDDSTAITELAPIIAGILCGIIIILVLVGVLVFYRFRKKTPDVRLKVSTNNAGDLYYSDVVETKSTLNTKDVEKFSQNTSDNEETRNRKNKNFAGETATASASVYSYSQAVIQNETTDNEYADQGETYNILNVHPSKTSENCIYTYDRSVDNTYDSTKQSVKDTPKDTGLYDLSTMKSEGEYDTTSHHKIRLDNEYGFD